MLYCCLWYYTMECGRWDVTQQGVSYHKSIFPLIFLRGVWWLVPFNRLSPYLHGLDAQCFERLMATIWICEHVMWCTGLKCAVLSFLCCTQTPPQPPVQKGIQVPTILWLLSHTKYGHLKIWAQLCTCVSILDELGVSLLCDRRA